MLIVQLPTQYNPTKPPCGHQKRCDCGCLWVLFANPHPFQTETVHHLAFAFEGDPSLVLMWIWRTADGNSAWMVTLILVPLHDLGSNQVDKAMVPHHGIGAHYVEEHKYNNDKMLVERLSHYPEAEAKHNTILLVASPNSLSSEGAINLDEDVLLTCCQRVRSP